MKKRHINLIFFFLLWICFINANSQVTMLPDRVILPKMTTANKNNLLNKQEGMMIYDTDLKQFSYWTGALWANFGNAASSTDWQKTGQNLSNTNSGSVGINTTDPQAKFHVNGSSIIANNSIIDPDLNANTVVAGAIADGSGWNIQSGIGGKSESNGWTWALGGGSGSFFIGCGNGTSNNSLQTAFKISPNRNISLAEQSGNVTIGQGSENTKLHINGGVSLKREVITTTHSNFIIDVGNRSYLLINGAPVGTPAHTIILSDGLSVGQILVIQSGTLANAIFNGSLGSFIIKDNADDYNTDLKNDFHMDVDQFLTLIWDGLNWRELSRSEN